MNLFRSVKDYFSPPRQTGKPYNLEPSTVEHLKRLRTSSEWPAYLTAIDTLVRLYAEALLSSKDAYQDAYYKGIVVGLQKAACLPDELEQREKLDAGEELRREQSANRRSELARKLATFGTPAWRGPTQ